MDEPIAESSIGYSYEAPRTGRHAATEASIKKSWDPSDHKVLFRHKNIQKRKSKILRTVDSQEMKV